MRKALRVDQFYSCPAKPQLRSQLYCQLLMYMHFQDLSHANSCGRFKEKCPLKTSEDKRTVTTRGNQVACVELAFCAPGEFYDRLSIAEHGSDAGSEV